MRKRIVLCLGIGLAVVSHTLTAASDIPTGGPQAPSRFVCDDRVVAPPCFPTGPTPAMPPPEPRGYAGISNPAELNFVARTDDDPLGGFCRRPLDRFIIPEGGAFLDPTRDGDPHFGIDYSDPTTYLNGDPVYVHPIGPGYVTARASCMLCFAEGDARGRVDWKHPEYNFGFGDVVLVETPYTTTLSIYVLYAHLNRDFVSLGDYVTPDEIIGVTGNTGFTENNHVHIEVRFGFPGRFWNADFTHWDTLARWQATMFINPALLVFPENHPGLISFMDEWLALQPQPHRLP